MLMDNERIERFKADAAELQLKAGRPERERWWLAAGVVLMVAGIAVALVTYEISLGRDDPRDLQSDIVLVIAMLGVVVLGAAVFVRYAIARFLRLWLLRQLYEGEANTDRIVDALRSRET
jgi:hypothetical protein